MKLVHLILALTAVFAGVVPQARATHFPSGTQTVTYDGTITAGTPTLTDALTGGTDPYDFFKVNLVAGQTFTVTMTRSSGDLLPNLHLWQGEAAPGAQLSTVSGYASGVALIDTANSNNSTVTASCTPAFTGVATLVASTWTGQTGSYSLTATGAGGAGAVAYVRSSFDSPWSFIGATDPGSNEAALNTAFGAGNWQDLRFETVNPATLFSATYGMIFLEGGDSNATALETFLTAHAAALQQWVSNGGRLLINAAPNQDNGMSFGFGVTLTYPNFTAAVAAAIPAHPIFSSPGAAGTTFTGGYFGHGALSGAGITSLIVGTGSDAGKVVLAELNYGAGKALFGGMTLAYFHDPKPQSYALLSNILTYLRGSPETGPGANDPSFSVTGRGLLLGTALQPDGKVLAGGMFSAFGPVNGQTVGNTLRFETDGALDAGFTPPGAAYNLLVLRDGRILTGPSRVNANGTTDASFAPTVPFKPIAVQNDGKIVGVDPSAYGGSGHLTRLHADGSLDASFPVSNFAADGLALQTDGKIVTWGYDPATFAWRMLRLNANGAVDGAFTPALFGSALVRAAAIQGDGRIVVGGIFSLVNGVTRNNVARLNTDGTLDGSFNPNVGVVNSEGVRSIVTQTDGKVLIAGRITSVSGTARTGLIRLHADGTLDTSFVTPGVAYAAAPAIQADGKIVFGSGATGDFLVNPLLVRVLNDPAAQALTAPSPSTVQWLRSGSAPETQQVRFEISTDGGNTWSALGYASRIAGGWRLAGLSLPASGRIRAQARTVSGEFSGSTGLVEQVAAFSLAGVNRPPVAVTDNFVIPQGSTVELDVLANDSDPDGDLLTITGIGVTVGGTATVSAGGTRVVWQQGGGSTGTFVYYLSDGRGAVVQGVVNLTEQQIVPLIVARPAGSWAAFALGSGLTCSESAVGNTAIDGDVGLAVGGGVSLSGRARLGGDVYLRTYGTVVKAGQSVIAGTVFPNQDGMLAQGVADARSAAAAAVALAASPGTPATINGTTNLTGSGTTVLNLTDLVLASGMRLTLTGDASTKFIVNVSGRCSLSAGSLLLAGGIPARNVLLNVAGPGTDVSLLAGAQIHGTVLAFDRAVTLGSASTIIGGVVAKKVSLSAGSSARRAP